jgi:hypothetical protein
MNNLPTDLYRKIIKEYIFSKVLEEFAMDQHFRKYKFVLDQIDQVCSKEHFVTSDGSFFYPNPGWRNDNGYLTFICMDPVISSRLQSHYPNLEIGFILSTDTVKLQDDYHTGKITTEEFLKMKRYFDVSIANSYKDTPFFTFETEDSNVLQENDECYFIKLPNDCFKDLWFKYLV